jgi:BASS family bile acid:Na+ symporter
MLDQLMLLRVLETGVPVVAFLMMVAVGLDVTRADLRRVASLAPAIAAITLGQAVLLPIAAWLLTALVPSAHIAAFLLLVGACPGGGMSNVYVYLARANTALSVTLTAISSLGALATMPVVFTAYRLVAGRDAGFAVPLPTLLAQLLIMAVIPVTAGAWIRDRYPELERAYGGRFRALSAAGVVLIVSIGIVQSAGTLTIDLAAGGGVATILVALGMAAGWLLGAALRMGAADRFTLLVEFAVRNLAIAMVIEVTLLGHPDFIAFGALALLGQAVLVGLAVVARARAAPA